MAAALSVVAAETCAQPEELAAGGWQPGSAPPISLEMDGIVRSLSSWSNKDASEVVHCPWQRVFDRFDTGRNGLLDVAEVSEGLRILLGSPVTGAMLKAAMQKFDKDMSGQLDIIEFGKLLNDLKDSRKLRLDPPILRHAGSVLGKDKQLPLQDVMFRIYHSRLVSTFVAFCIIGNFVINVLEKQIDADTKNPKYDRFWFMADVSLNIIFLFELLANMWSCGGPVKAFWASGWNVFDTIIVSVGVLTMMNVLRAEAFRTNKLNKLNKLKLCRAFRIFRLFKRVESLNKITIALLNSIPGVVNAFIVMLVFFCIYAIVAVGLFRDFGHGGTFEEYDSITGHTITVNSTTARGLLIGIEYYGTFMRAIYTLFQVMTGDSWSEVVVRPLLFSWFKGNAIIPSLFFVSFILLTQIVLINVVVAVLLDKFVANEATEQDEDIAVDARLKGRDGQDEMKAMNAKLDQVIDSFSILSNSLTELNASVAHLKNRMDHKDQIQVVRMAPSQSSI